MKGNSRDRTSRKHVHVMYTTLTPLLYSKTGVCRGIPIFLIFAPKHRLWVLVRTASARRFQRVPTIYVLSINKKNIRLFLWKIFIFDNFKNLCILHGRVFVMNRHWLRYCISCIHIDNISYIFFLCFQSGGGRGRSN